MQPGSRKHLRQEGIGNVMPINDFLKAAGSTLIASIFAQALVSKLAYLQGIGTHPDIEDASKSILHRY